MLSLHLKLLPLQQLLQLLPLQQQLLLLPVPLSC